MLIGAGISLRSGLPDGATLAEKAFDMVAAVGPILLKDTELAELRGAAKRLRLEILLERLATEVPKGFLFSVFGSLKDASPNFNHLAIIALKPRSVVTTNQDPLLEMAAELLGEKYTVIHLHGRCDDKQSIITTISQYLAGLRPSIAEQFRASLHATDIVVLGYSGRDGDVMALLGEGAMKSITWLHHPGGERSPELRRLKERLQKRMKIIVKDANKWLKGQLPKARCSELESMEGNLNVAARHPHKLPTGRFDKLTALEANLALGRILEHVGQYDVAYKFYLRLMRHVRGMAAFPETETRVQLAIGRVQTFQYQFKKAYRRYIGIARDASVPNVLRCQALADCLTVLRNASNYRGAQRILNELEDLLSTTPWTAAFLKFRGESAAARAGMLRLDGVASESIKLYQRADRYFRRAHDVDGWIEASTWVCDNLLTLGRFRDADVYLKRAIDNSGAYGRYFSKAWSLFLRGELLGFGGNVTAGLKIIEQTYKYFRQINNPQGQVYSLLYISDFLREMSLMEAGRALGQADKLLQDHKFTYAKGRFLLEKAELARARGRSSEVRTYLAMLQRHLQSRRRFNAPPYLLMAHGKCVAAEHAREIGSPNATNLLNEARGMYAALGASYYVLRIDVARWLISRTNASRSELMAVCKREGYGHEMQRLKIPSAKHYPLHFV
jgi:tetratricopeptide (TPR) repeat protein